jgi:hypothetical protein
MKTLRKETNVLENLVPCRTTFSTASKKSRSDATFRRARIANIPAYSINIGHAAISIKLTSVATDRSSAPVVFGHSRAIRSNRMSLSTLMLMPKRRVKENGDRLNRKKNHTFEHGCVVCVPDLHYLVTKIPLVDLAVQAAKEQDQVYRV